jgi:hypothetical protein
MKAVGLNVHNVVFNFNHFSVNVMHVLSVDIFSLVFVEELHGGIP